MTARLVFVALSCLAAAAVGLRSSSAPNTSVGVLAVAADQVRVPRARHRRGDSRFIVDVRSAPYAAAIGRLRGTMVCTAAIVLHPRIVITAAHCVAISGASGSELTFQPGYNAGTSLGQFKATIWAIGARQRLAGQSARDAANDWAILLLEHPPTGIRPLGLSSRSADALKQLGPHILLPSYSLDVAGAQALSVDPTCSVHDMLWNVLLHDCQASLGSSGAPLLIRDRQWYELVGIHSASMLASDQAHHSMQLIGNSATGVWTFAEALDALLKRLNSDNDAVVVGSQSR